MSETIELSYVWDHTISKILYHDLQSDMGSMIQQIGRFQFIVEIHW